MDETRIAKWLGVAVTLAAGLYCRLGLVSPPLAMLAGLPGGFVAGVPLRRYQEPLRRGAYVGGYAAVPYVVVVSANAVASPITFFINLGIASFLVFALPLTGAVGAFLAKGLTRQKTLPDDRPE